MMNKSGNQRTEETRRQLARVLIIAIALLGFAQLVSVVSITLSGDWVASLQDGLVLVGLGYLVALLAAFWLNRRGQPIWAARLTIGALLIAMLVVVLRVTGFGLMLSVGAFLLTAFIVGQIRLPGRQALELVVAGAVGAVLILLLDLFAPIARTQSGADTQFTSAASLLIGFLVLGGLALRHWREFRLRTKLIIGFIAISAVAVVAVSAIVSQTVTSNLTLQQGAALRTIADNRATIVGDLLERQKDLLQTIASTQSIHNIASLTNALYGTEDRAVIQKQIDGVEQQWVKVGDGDPAVQPKLTNTTAVEFLRFQSDMQDNTQVLLTDQYGAIIASTFRTAHYYLGDQAWWQTAYNGGQGKLYISQPQTIERLGGYWIIIAIPVYGGDNLVIGVLQGLYPVAALQQALTVTPGTNTGSPDLIFPSGLTLHGEGDVTTLAPALLNRLHTMTQDYARLSYENGDAFVSRANVAASRPSTSGDIPGLGWMVVVDQDPQIALQPVLVASQAAIFSGLGVFLLAVLFAGIGAQFFAGPIIKLTQTAEKITGGDLTLQASVSSEDEIGELATAFNRMTGQLRQTLGTLEQRVDARTAELARANDQLSTRANQLEASAEISRAVAATLQLDELLNTVPPLLAARFGFDRATIYLVDENSREAALHAASGRTASGSFLNQRISKAGERVAVDESNFVGHVIAAGHLRVAECLADDPLYKTPPLPGIQSRVTLPLIVAGQTIGAVDLLSTQVRLFSQSDLTGLSGLADQIAVAIQNARSFERQVALTDENRRSLERQTALADENRLLLERTQKAVQELNALNQRLSHEGWTVYEQTAGDLVGQAERSTLVNPVSEIPALDQAAAKGDLVTLRADGGTVVAVPIIVRGQVIGSMAVQDCEAQNDWTADEIATLRDVSEHVALALDNARLFEQTQAALEAARQAAERDARLAAINDRLHAGTDIEGILRTAVEELRITTGRTRAVVRLARRQ
ncbi:MAG: GAF domain-containing protein [Anaerolineae bacterium]